MSIQDVVGRSLGLALAPLAFFASAIRRDRIFHPDGVVYRADVTPVAQHELLEPLALRLAGTALVRLSGAVWSWPRGRRRPDILGVAVRFRGKHQVTPGLAPGDQDLLFATASSLLGLVVAPAAADTSDFLGNRYHTILPFTFAGLGRVYLRLVPSEPAPAGADRRERLAFAVAHNKATLQLELQAPELGAEWLPLAAIDLRERLLLDDSVLVFYPGTSAKGLVPRGLLQALRPEIYTASEAGRRLTGR